MYDQLMLFIVYDASKQARLPNNQIYMSSILTLSHCLKPSYLSLHRHTEM